VTPPHPPPRGLPRPSLLPRSPAFTAPELCGESVRAVDGRAADLWALGVTLYVLVYGRLPFRGSGAVQLFEAIRHAELVCPAIVSQGADSGASDPLPSAPLPLSSASAPLGLGSPPAGSSAWAIDSRLIALLGRLLTKAPQQRASMEECFAHDWITSCGAEPLARVASEEGAMKVSVSREEISSALAAVTSSRARTSTAVLRGRAVSLTPAAASGVRARRRSAATVAEVGEKPRAHRRSVSLSLPRAGALLPNTAGGAEPHPPAALESSANAAGSAESAAAHRAQPDPERRTELVPAEVVHRQQRFASQQLRRPSFPNPHPSLPLSSSADAPPVEAGARALAAPPDAATAVGAAGVAAAGADGVRSRSPAQREADDSALHGSGARPTRSRAHSVTTSSADEDDERASTLTTSVRSVHWSELERSTEHSQLLGTGRSSMESLDPIDVSALPWAPKSLETTPTHEEGEAQSEAQGTGGAGGVGDGAGAGRDAVRSLADLRALGLHAASAAQLASLCVDWDVAARQHGARMEDAHVCCTSASAASASAASVPASASTAPAPTVEGLQQGSGRGQAGEAQPLVREEPHPLELFSTRGALAPPRTASPRRPTRGTRIADGFSRARDVRLCDFLVACGCRRL
jgi:serine/threonine protein kinase